MGAGDDQDDLSFEVASIDKYRTRSKSVATLTAAAAGALAAGLALNSELVSFPFATRTLGLAAIVLLILATCAFVVASVLHGKSTEPAKNKRAKLNRFLRPWEARFTSSGEWPTVEEYRASVETVGRHIMRATDVGMWIATAAILSLVWALVSMLVINEERVAVSVSIFQSSATSGLCPDLPATFEATVRSVDIESSSATLMLEIPGAVCREASDLESVTLAVPRAHILFGQKASP